MRRSVSFTDAEWLQVKSYFSERHLHKNDLLQKQGCLELAFVA